MGEQVGMWRSVDGEIFMTEAEMDRHEVIVFRERLISDYLADRTWERGQRARAEAVLTNFMDWQEYRAAHAEGREPVLSVVPVQGPGGDA